MMQLLIKLLVLMSLSAFFNLNALAQSVEIELFARETCPHCANAKAFLTKLQQEQPELKTRIYDIEKEANSLEKLQALAKQQNVVARVPAFFVNGQLIVGYADENTTGRLLRDVITQKNSQTISMQNEIGSCEIQTSLECTAPVNQKTDVFELDFLGQKLSLSEIGLPVFTLAMGLLDGFNPCSMWVLILIISLLAPIQNRSRMLAIAGTFVAIEGIVYFLFMSAWLNMFLWIGLSRISEIIIATIALIAGIVNLKDFLFLGKGFSLSISAKHKTTIYARLRKILNAQNLTGALIGITILALLVQMVEFMCTSGFPALYTRILTLQHFDNSTYYGYLLLYNLAYMFDDLVILAVGVVTLSPHRLQEKEARYLKLASGLVMVGLGIYLLA